MLSFMKRQTASANIARLHKELNKEKEILEAAKHAAKQARLRIDKHLATETPEAKKTRGGR